MSKFNNVVNLILNEDNDRNFYYRENPDYDMIDVIDSNTGEVYDQIESMYDAMQELNSLAMEVLKLKGKEIKFNSYGDSIK